MALLVPGGLILSFDGTFGNLIEILLGSKSGSVFWAAGAAGAFSFDEDGGGVLGSSAAIAIMSFSFKPDMEVAGGAFGF